MQLKLLKLCARLCIHTKQLSLLFLKFNNVCSYRPDFERLNSFVNILLDILLVMFYLKKYFVFPTPSCQKVAVYLIINCNKRCIKLKL